MIDNIDPYEVPKKEWSFDRIAYPDVKMSDIIFYLVYKKSFYRLQTKISKRKNPWNPITISFVDGLEMWLPKK